MNQIKPLLSDPPILQYFDPKAKSMIQTDASQHGLGAVLLQRGKSIAYVSQSLNTTEQNNKQNKKELYSYWPLFLLLISFITTSMVFILSYNLITSH